MLTQCQVFGKAVCGISASCARELFSRRELVGRQVTGDLVLVLSEVKMIITNGFIYWTLNTPGRKLTVQLSESSYCMFCFIFKSSVSHSTRPKSGPASMRCSRGSWGVRTSPSTHIPPSTWSPAGVQRPSVVPLVLSFTGWVCWY